jgi:hypothetical protein
VILYFTKIVGADTSVKGKRDWIKPKLALTIGSSNMDMGRFNAFIRVKMESE